jgi:hypothetical protein
MPLTVFFSSAGNFIVDDDGIPGNNTSAVRDGSGGLLFPFSHPADSLTLTAETPGVNLTLNFFDTLGAADFFVGALADPAQNPNSVVVKRIDTTGDVTLVSNAKITEGGADAAADIVAGTLLLSASEGVGTPSNALETQVGIIEAETTTGGINLSNFGAVQIGGLNDLVDGLSVLTSGNLSLTTVGSIFLSETDLDPGNPPAAALESVHGGNTSGNVTLIANGSSSDIVANTNRDAVTAAGGNITLSAGRDVVFGTAGANFDNDVRARGSVTINAGRDFIIDGFSDLASDGSGANTGGDVIINVGRNMHVRNVAGTDASVVASGSAGADVIVTTGAGGALILDAPTSDALSSSSGDVTVNADRMLISASSGIAASAGEVTLRPATDGRAINLGSAGDAALAVELSDAELDRIFTPSLLLGGPDTGTVTVSANHFTAQRSGRHHPERHRHRRQRRCHRAGHRRAAVAGGRRYRAGRRLRPGGRGAASPASSTSVTPTRAPAARRSSMPASWPRCGSPARPTATRCSAARPTTP